MCKRPCPQFRAPLEYHEPALPERWDMPLLGHRRFKLRLHPEIIGGGVFNFWAFILYRIVEYRDIPIYLRKSVFAQGWAQPSADDDILVCAGSIRFPDVSWMSIGNLRNTRIGAATSLAAPKICWHEHYFSDIHWLGYEEFYSLLRLVPTSICAPITNIHRGFDTPCACARIWVLRLRVGLLGPFSGSNLRIAGLASSTEFAQSLHFSCQQPIPRELAPWEEFYALYAWQAGQDISPRA